MLKYVNFRKSGVLIFNANIKLLEFNEITSGLFEYV